MENLSINEMEIIKYNELNITEKIIFFTNKLLKILKDKNELYSYYMTDPEIELIISYKDRINNILIKKGWQLEYKNGPHTWDNLKIIKIN